MLTTQRVTHIRVPPHRRCFMAFVVLISALSAVRAADPPNAKRLPVPDNAARDKALASVRNVFKTDIDKAKTPAEQTTLSEKLAKVARETKDDPVARFVLWQLATELATKAGDINAAFAALDEVAKNYDVDELSVKSRTFASLVPRLTVKNYRDALVFVPDLLGRAAGGDRYDVAAAIVDATDTLVDKFGDAGVKKEWTPIKREVEGLKKSYADVPAANKTLDGKVTDPAANLIVGRYLLAKGDWEQAMSYLALSNDPQYQDVAVKELSQPKDFAGRLAIADGWWTVGEADKTLLKDRFQAHAAEWYQLSLADASGLTKVKIQTRLTEAGKIAKPPLAIKASLKSVPTSFTNSIGMKLNLIPAGEFLMGSPETERGHNGTERQHRVKITKPFYMAVYPVAQEEYEKVMGTNPSRFAINGDHREKVVGLRTGRFPVENVTWFDAQDFCNRLGNREAKLYRLPTEAEWEYACRSGTTTAFNFGDACNGTQGNCKGTVPYGNIDKGPNLARPTPVGMYKPNALGLYDMHGNIWQWVTDWHIDDYYGKSPLQDPTGPASALDRVTRGGAWDTDPIICRSAERGHTSPANHNPNLGFRVIRDISTEQSSKREVAPTVVVSARWGDGTIWADVTKIAQEAVAKGDLVWANNDYFKGDPTPGKRKHLEVTYEKDGRRSTVKIEENEAFK